MDNAPKTNTDNENLRDLSKGDGDTGRREDFHKDDNSGSDSLNDDRTNTGAEDTNDTDKYLAMEQPGVTYTQDNEPSNLSDNLDYKDSNTAENKWEEDADNGLLSDAFNQDNYILTDNVDLDEDQNKSISSDDEDFEESNERYTS